MSHDLIEVTANMPSYTPNMNVEYKVEWVLTTNEQFSVNSAWNTLRVHHPIVQWHSIVWHKDSVPRCSFVLRLVCRDKRQAVAMGLC